MLVTTTLWLSTALLLDRYGTSRSRPLTPREAIIVAGCPPRPDGRPTQTLKRRVELALSLHRAGLAPRLVMTGGPSLGHTTEARAAADYAIEQGAPPSSITLETYSRSTEENARLSRELIDSQKIFVVTDSYHVRRCELLFSRYFEEVRGVGSIGPRMSRAKNALREVGAFLADGARGRLDQRRKYSQTSREMHPGAK